jgi:WD40 repeat protein
MAVTSDGSHVLLASQTPYNVLAFRVDDLSSDGYYDTDGTTPSSVVATNEAKDVMVGNSQLTYRNVLIFRQGDSAYFNTRGLAGLDSYVADNGLSLSRDDGLLFVIGQQEPGGTVNDFYVFPDPIHVITRLSCMADPDAIDIGQGTRLWGRLSFDDGSSSAGRTIELTRKNPDGSKVVVADVPLDPQGDYSITDSPPQAGPNVYTATFAGDDTYASASAKATVQVSANGKIVFDSDKTGNFDVFTVDADGSNEQQLTHNGADDYDPAWSPDGSKIAFSSNRSGNYEIWTMNADGSGLTQLTKDPHFDAAPDWSPDGSQIAFESDRSGNVDVWTVDLSTGTLHRRTASPGLDEFPSWSPDGLHIAFDSDRSGDFEVYMMKTDGSDVTDISNDATASDGGASWSPNAGTLAFGSDRSGQFEVYAYVFNTHKLKRITLSQGFDGEQSYSPDGSLLAFSSDRGGSKQIWVMTKDGHFSWQYTDGGDVSELPDWSGVP